MHLKILNQRRSKRRRLKGSFAPYRSASSIRGGKKAMKSNTFQIVVSVRILLSASCIDANHHHARLLLLLACWMIVGILANAYRLVHKQTCRSSKTNQQSACIGMHRNP